MLWNSFIYFVGGIGLFLYGMHLMSDGLELSTGSKLKRILELLTKNKILGVLVGFVVTAIIQSSTATSVMIVGFVNASLLTLGQAIGVIIGANIGSAVTSLIIALNLHNLAPICIFVGALLILFTKNKKLKYTGMIIAGFGILFLGLKVMTDAMRPLSDTPWLLDIFKYTENPFFGILLGFTLTAIIQSSTASIGILLAMMSAGIITDLNQAIFILYGQNLGTCLTAVISSLGLKNIAKKAAMIHFIYNFLGISVFVIITLLPFGFADFIKSLTTNVSQQLVYTHIIVNILMAIMLLPLSGFIIKITEFIIRSKDEKKTDSDFIFVDESLLDNPAFAIVCIYKEIERMAHIALDNLILAKKIVIKNKYSSKDIEKIQKNEDTINHLGGKINSFLTKLSSKDLLYSDVKLVATLYHVITDIERLGNHSVNIVEAFDQLKDEKNKFSQDAYAELDSMFSNVENALTKSVNVFASAKYSNKVIKEVQKIENLVDNQNEEYKNNHLERSNDGDCTLEAGVAFVKILTDLERIADYSCNIAYAQYKKNI